MKPVAIFRFTETEGPGYFATFLDHHQIPWQLFAIDLCAPVPVSAEAFSGLCLMGGPMSVNDPLPWIEPLCILIRDASTKGIPVIGHCLGGQLMSKAFGGEITRSPFKEIGWGTAVVEPSYFARRWFGTMNEVSVFQWHGETFSIPPGAHRILSNPFCSNQMFVLGPNLAMQCHIEMTEEMISTWCESWESEVKGLEMLPASVQTPEQMRAEAITGLQSLRQLADQLYTQWSHGLRQ